MDQIRFPFVNGKLWALSQLEEEALGQQVSASQRIKQDHNVQQEQESFVLLEFKRLKSDSFRND